MASAQQQTTENGGLVTTLLTSLPGAGGEADARLLCFADLVYQSIPALSTTFFIFLKAGVYFFPIPSTIQPYQVTKGDSSTMQNRENKQDQQNNRNQNQNQNQQQNNRDNKQDQQNRSQKENRK